ncbi:MAG: hypothetical protein WC390_06615 [Sulfurimonas sp.]|jgi:hypothetical protein
MSPDLSLPPIERLRIWFRDPVKKLSGDDAFVCLSISLSLFERYVYAVLSEEGSNADKKSFEKKASDILQIDLEVVNKFWGMYRTGLQHFLQPKIFESNGIKYRWEICGNFSAKPELVKKAPNLYIVRIDPWKWFNLVFDLWEKRPDLLDRLSDFPLGEIY